MTPPTTSAREPGPAFLTEPKPTLRHLLTETDRFVTAVELVTSRGLITEDKPQRVLALARELVRHPRIDVLSMTDNPAGNAMLAADTLGTDLVSRGQEVIIHLACKDWNRNAIQSRAWKLASEGFHNILALSGDAPSGGYRGVASSVFDIDSVGLLRMYTDMNAGTVLHGRTEAEVQRTRFFLGTVVTNHKPNENEVMPQLFKLRKKIANGARFVINQIGYNARKDHELLQWMRAEGLDVPVLANVFVLSPGAARAFNAGRVPGVKVSDALAQIVARESRSADRGRAFFHDLAARQVAIARGLGFRGAYLGGHLGAEDYLTILDAADAYAEGWRDLAREIQFDVPGEWYLYERDPATGLASDEVNREYAASRRRGLRRRRVPARYRLARVMHKAVFAEDAPLFDAGRRFYERVDQAPKGVARALHLAEQAAKVPMFGCEDCGDCSLPDIAYLCPESQCAKNQRNGPCGGTREGSKCEVGEKTCIWALAYDRLKAYGEEREMLDGPVVIKDNALAGTSAWGNTFLGRDHHARAEPAPEDRQNRPEG
jgi:methylenetetrahydrofolate reductase (NADPH)